MSYDVLVFGSQLAGAVTAGLLAKRGYRVLAVAHDALPTSYADGAYLLPCGPSVLPPLRSMPAAAAVLEELGAATDVYRSLVPLSPPLQLLGERMRLDVPREAPLRAAELRRELGAAGTQAAAGLERLLAEEETDGPFYKPGTPFPAQGFFERLRLKRALGGHAGLDGSAELPDGDERFSRALRELWHLGSFLWDERPPSRASLRPLAQLLRGLQRREGGIEGLAAELRHRVVTAGGTVLEGDESSNAHDIEELRLEGGRILSAKLEGSPHEYRASYFVAATGAAELRDLLPASAAEGKLAGLLGGVKTRSAFLTLNLVVDIRGIPPGLGPAALCLPSKAETPSVFLQLTPAQPATGKIVTESRVVQLTRQVPAHLFQAGEAQLKAILLEMRALASEYLPFIDRHILLESSPHLQEERALASHLRVHPLVEVGLPRQLGVTGLPPRPPCKNLVLASRDVLPGLGIEGEFLTGALAAEIVQRELPKKEILK
jgi:phytoene dehydrogenase-like protein